MTIPVSTGIMILTSITIATISCPEPSIPTDTGEESGTATDESDGDGDGDGDSLGDGDGDETESDGEESEDSTDTGEACGDVTLQIGEECDGWNTGLETCKTLGFADGELGCHDDCTFDTSGCIAPGCGNGILEEPELCEGTPYPCWLLGYAGSTTENGMAECGTNCMPDETACDPTCEWGDSGCFCWAATPCPLDEECVPHPLFPGAAPGTCHPISCVEPGGLCSNTAPSGFTCCPGLRCVDNICV